MTLKMEHRRSRGCSMEDWSDFNPLPMYLPPQGYEAFYSIDGRHLLEDGDLGEARFLLEDDDASKAVHMFEELAKAGSDSPSDKPTSSDDGMNSSLDGMVPSRSERGREVKLLPQMHNVPSATHGLEHQQRDPSPNSSTTTTSRDTRAPKRTRSGAASCTTTDSSAADESFAKRVALEAASAAVLPAPSTATDGNEVPAMPAGAKNRRREWNRLNAQKSRYVSTSIIAA
jgi:hypothetical protein